jgi:hypothetical protein
MDAEVPHSVCHVSATDKNFSLIFLISLLRTDVELVWPNPAPVVPAPGAGGTMIA